MYGNVMKTTTVIAFFIGFFSGPMYFSYVYPLLYHLILP